MKNLLYAWLLFCPPLIYSILRVDTIQDEPKLQPVVEVESEIWDICDPNAFYIADYLGSRLTDLDHVEVLELSQLILDKSNEYNLDPILVLAVIHVESTYDTCAYSKYGAKGLMQVMPRRILHPEELQDYAFSHHTFYDPAWNIEFGVDYLAYLVDRFGNLETALAAYNAGPTRIARKYPKQVVRTRYVRKVMRRYARLESTIPRT